MSRTLSHVDHDQVIELLMGRTVEVTGPHALRLDNGIELELPDTDGGCACSSGCYDLTTLNAVPNIITKVEFVDSPDDEYGDGDGRYQIFVFTGAERINLATWEGTDGNGYYGTGYSINVLLPGSSSGATT
jgi:hypothetical protein